MINPDGVSRGHYRTDSHGYNLNRFYDAPDPTEHPSIVACKGLALRLHKDHLLRFHFDLHAHAPKRGCFMYGNAFPDIAQQIEGMLLARCLSL